MLRTILSVLLATLPLTGSRTTWGAPRPGPPPTTYELMINGESFLVEANRQIKLQSKDKPGVSYQVAIRVAPVQRLKLNTLRFQYDQRFEVEDSRQPQRRSVNIP